MTSFSDNNIKSLLPNCLSVAAIAAAIVVFPFDAGSATFFPPPLLLLIVVLFLLWTLSAPAVFNDRKGPRALPLSLVDDGGVCAQPSAIVNPVPLSFCISCLCMSLSVPCPPPSFVDCCVMIMPAANKNLRC